LLSSLHYCIYHGSSCKYKVCLLSFLVKLAFVTHVEVKSHLSPCALCELLTAGSHHEQELGPGHSAAAASTAIGEHG